MKEWRQPELVAMLVGWVCALVSMVITIGLAILVIALVQQFDPPDYVRYFMLLIPVFYMVFGLWLRRKALTAMGLEKYKNWPL